MRRLSVISKVLRPGRASGVGLLFLLTLAFTGCSLLSLNNREDFDIVFKPTTSLLVVVEDRLIASLQTELDVYQADLLKEGITTTVVGWQGGTAGDLRALIGRFSTDDSIDGAFLVGDLPAAWYRAYTFGAYEEFPCDLYLMDPAATWRDTNGDARYDAHSPLALKLYVSRLTGSGAEIAAYFDKVHRYRTGDVRIPVKAYLFKDDAWSAYQPGSTFGLGRIYDSVEIRETPGQTVRSVYVSDMTGEGMEFVNQWIHSQPSVLAIYDTNQADYGYVSTNDIKTYNFNGLFFDLYDCNAARFTQENLGMSYLTGTDYALAVFGSTKTGASYYSLAFYDVLSKHGTWGDAYKSWYNYYGKNDDAWFLGMVILGDPALKVSARGPIYRFIDLSLAPPPDATQRTELKRVTIEFTKGQSLSGFRAYKKAHPEYFR